MTGYYRAMANTGKKTNTGNRVHNLGMLAGQMLSVTLDPTGKVIARHAWLPEVKTLDEAKTVYAVMMAKRNF